MVLAALGGSAQRPFRGERVAETRFLRNEPKLSLTGGYVCGIEQQCLMRIDGQNFGSENEPKMASA